ncbi:MAG: 3-hydroxyacyl-ACP dehydratase FabZ [Methylobacillus glycogenes]|nr:3-hydroxyacyl-ACP dehydratase FabZ [Methylobacillus glycogenes]
MPVLDIQAIEKILPHRYPFLLVDRILELEDMRVVALKNVTANEQFFNGHFPGMKVMPGVLIVEAMAQAAAILVLNRVPDRENKVVFFASISECKFRRPVVPGDQLRIEIDFLRLKPSVAKIQGKALVDGQVVCEAEIMATLNDRPKV